MTDQSTWDWVLQSVSTNPDKAVIVRLEPDGNLSFLHGDPTKELELELSAAQARIDELERELHSRHERLLTENQYHDLHAACADIMTLAERTTGSNMITVNSRIVGNEMWRGLQAKKELIECRQKSFELDREVQKICAERDAAHARIAELERELRIAECKNRGTLANNLCPDHRDKQVGKPCLACAVDRLERERDALRVLPNLETVAANVHAAWVQAKQAAGIKSRLAEDGEELMVPYAELSDKQQEMDRLLVRQVYDAIGKAREMK